MATTSDADLKVCGIDGIDPGDPCTTIDLPVPPVLPPVDPPQPPGGPGAIEFITASASGSGIWVNWRYPIIYPEKVAFINLYRSTTPNFASTGDPIAVTQSSSYLDPDHQLTVDQVYYYWVRVVSTAGDPGTATGPASATAVDGIDEWLEKIQNKLNDTHLNSLLREGIADITSGNSSLTVEQQEQKFGIALFSLLLEESFFDKLKAIDTLIYENQLEYVKGDLAVAGRISVIHAQSNDNKATILEEQGVRASKDAALAYDSKIVTAKVGETQVSVKILNEAEIGNGIMRGGHVVTVETQQNDDTKFISGFGIYNEKPDDPELDTQSSFLIHADNFAVGLPDEGSNFYIWDEELEKDVLVNPSDMKTVYPFSVNYVTNSNGGKEPKISLNADVIANDIRVKGANIEGVIRSDVFHFNYGQVGGANTPNQGWAIFPNGTAIFTNAVVSGTVTAGYFVKGSVGTIDLGINSATFGTAGLGHNYATSGNLFSRGYTAPNDGVLFLTVGGNMQCNAGQSVYLTVSAGSNSTRHEVYANDGTGSSNSWIRVPASTSVTSQAGGSGISASLSGSGSISAVWWSVVILKR